MTPRFEAVLARLYVDADARRAFLTDPAQFARAMQLDVRETAALLSVDRPGLELASQSYARKRAAMTAGVTRWPRVVRLVRRVIGRAKIPARSGHGGPITP